MPNKSAPDFSPMLRRNEVLSALRHHAFDLGFDAMAFSVLQEADSVSPLWNCQPLANCMSGQRRPGACAQDPACRMARRKLVPFLWSDLAPDAVEICAFDALKRSIPDLSIACVGTIPLHGPMGSLALHVAGDCTPAEFRNWFRLGALDLLGVATMAHQRLLELAGDAVGDISLTDRQQDVLFWVVQGKTNWEIGKIIGISSDTVRRHVMNIAGAMHVTNRVQVAAVAVARGMGSPL